MLNFDVVSTQFLNRDDSLNGNCNKGTKTQEVNTVGAWISCESDSDEVSV